MDKHAVLSKTGKGLLQLKYKSHPMPDDQFRVLGLIDGKAMVIDLIASSQMNEAGLYNVLRALAESGFVRKVAVPAATPDSPNVTVAPALASEIDLDFTRSLGAAWKAPKGDVSLTELHASVSNRELGAQPFLAAPAFLMNPFTENGPCCCQKATNRSPEVCAMFVNMETTVFQELVNAEANSRWNALVARLLCSDQRELVVGKVASALQRSICEQEMPCDALAADLYAQALKRVDFYTIALEPRSRS